MKIKRLSTDQLYDRIKNDSKNTTKYLGVCIRALPGGNFTLYDGDKKVDITSTLNHARHLTERYFRKNLIELWNKEFPDQRIVDVGV